MRALGQKEVSSSGIGEITLTELRKTDEVMYIRIASFYREFRDADEFAQELNALQELDEPETTRWFTHRVVSR